MTVPSQANSAMIASRFPAWIVVACVCFNFVLCIINTNIAPISNAHIIFCEIVLSACATAYGFRRIDRARLYWLGVLLLQILWLLFLSCVRDEALIKPIRDVIIMPVFVVLGLSSPKIKMNGILIRLGLFVVLIALLEACFVHDFLKIVNFRKYFEVKGMMDVNGPDYTHLDVFASGIRANNAFLFRIPGLHRISSVFLEPVSLGFFGFILGLYFVAVKPRLDKGVYYAGLFIAILLILLSDARMALGSLVLIMACRPLLLKIDHRFSALIFPTMFVIAIAIYMGDWVGHSGEGIGARIHWTMNVLSGMNTDVLLGAAGYPGTMEDSALAKLLGTQGLPGFLMYWLAPVFFMRKLPAEARIYLFGAAVFLSFGFMLSAAIFSIKTAALLWFLYGYLIALYKGGTNDPGKFVADLS